MPRLLKSELIVFGRFDEVASRLTGITGHLRLRPNASRQSILLNEMAGRSFSGSKRIARMFA
jgi:hypothetical protein